LKKKKRRNKGYRERKEFRKKATMEDRKREQENVEE
jgi:hypothetical protein